MISSVSASEAVAQGHTESFKTTAADRQLAGRQLIHSFFYLPLISMKWTLFCPDSHPNHNVFPLSSSKRVTTLCTEFNLEK